jgi:hypothetical protein
MTNEFEIPGCESCGLVPDHQSVFNWFARVGKNRNLEAFFCPTCYETYSPKGQFITGIRFNASMQPGAPEIGAFRPVKSSAEIMYGRTDAFYGPFWLDLENQLLETFNEFGSKFMNFTISSHFYKGMKVGLRWSGDKVAGLTVFGTNSKRKLQLDIYQTYRLQQMGLIEFGEKEKTWEISFEPEEQTTENVVRVISHILEYGYMVKPARSIGISPQLDISADDFKR